MDRIKFFTIATVTLLCLMSCGGDDNNNDIEPKPTPQEEKTAGTTFRQTVTLPAEAGTQSVLLNGVKNQITKCDNEVDWLQVEVKENQTELKLTAIDNTSTKSRETVVTVIAAPDTVLLDVIQKGLTVVEGTDIDTPNDNVSDQPAYGRRH